MYDLNKNSNIIVSEFCFKNLHKVLNISRYKNIGVLETYSNQVVSATKLAIEFNKVRSGYRDGVVLVSPSIGDLAFNNKLLSCPIVTLTDGMTLIGEFKKRMDHEEPRKTVKVPNVEPTQAKYIDIVLYHRDVLAETHENTTNDVDWEVITILPKIDLKQPMPPETLCYNHFQLSGGTKTNMTDTEFVEALKESFIYWKDKVLI